MQLVEQQIIKKTDRRFRAIDQAAYKAARLYNQALYRVRQHVFDNYDMYLLCYNDIYIEMEDSEEYRLLPTKVAQQVLMDVDKNFRSYLAAHAEWELSPKKFLGEPMMPYYHPKLTGRHRLVYTIQAISSTAIRHGFINPSGLMAKFKTKIDYKDIVQVRINPRGDYYVVEVVYNKAEVQEDVDPSLICGVDMGVNNLMAITSNKAGFTPLLVNGRQIKSDNHYYNKNKALYQALHHDDPFTNRMRRMVIRRNRRVALAMHTISRRFVDMLVREHIGTVVIGKNVGWKQDCNMSRKNNQNFVQIPHAQLIDMITYKAQLVGIKVITTEESWTSKCSFLDHEEICHHDKYLGKRMKRGQFRTSTGRLINADVNGSYNIIVKVFPDAFGQGDRGCVVHPVQFCCTNSIGNK